jgi:hypothetical protein
VYRTVITETCDPFPFDRLLPEEYTFYVRLSWALVAGLFQFGEWVGLSQEPIAKYCSVGDQDTIAEISQLIQRAACDLSALLANTIVFFQCNNWFPLYEQGVYNAVCYSFTSGIFWIAATQIVIVVCAGIMLTFRVGLAKLPENTN